QVQDNGGTANGGVDLDQSANTLTVNVTSVNDAEADATKLESSSEDTCYTFAADNFGFSDPADGNSLLAVKISTLPAAGTLTLNGVAVATGVFVAASEIAAFHLLVTPPANPTFPTRRSSDLQVQDNGGTANGGVDLDQSANTLTVNVTSVN